MDIKDLTLRQIEELRSLFSGGGSACTDSHWKIGSAYLIRTVTHYLTGRLVLVTPKELVFESVAWIADTKRFSDCLRDGFSEQAEIEPAPEGTVIVGRQALIDAYAWGHELPREKQ